MAVAVAELDRTADKADLMDGLLVLQAELITYFAHVHAIVVAPRVLFVQEPQASFQEFITVKVQVELAASGVFAVAPKGIGVAIQTCRGAGTAPQELTLVTQLGNRIIFGCTGKTGAEPLPQVQLSQHQQRQV